MLGLERQLEVEKLKFWGQHDFQLQQIFKLFAHSPTVKLSIDSMHSALSKIGYSQRVDA